VAVDGNSAETSVVANMVDVTKWPARYQLPVFAPTIQSALNEKAPAFKNKGKSALRGHLINMLFDDISRYTWYVCKCGDF
jgi:hypothetical protein